MASSLKEKTARGLLWGAIDNGGMQLIGLIFGIILGRLLTPGDYGMIAMITIFSVIANALQESGLGRAIVNLDQPTDRECNSVFWFNIVVAASCYLLFFFLAPLIARYYHEPRLTALCRYAFLSFVLSAPGVVQSALMQKRLLVKQRTKANIAAVLTSSVIGSVMAWQGFGYWALATQTNTYILLNTIFYWRIAGWRPSLSFDPEPVRRMFRFSCKILASTIIFQINNNVLNILLGHYFSARATGYYNQAYQWNSKVIYLLQGMLGAVSQPVMVDLRNNPSRQLAALRKLVRFTAFLSFPLVLGFGLVSREFILITLTEKWLQSASYLEILCIGGAFLPISTPALRLHHQSGPLGRLSRKHRHAGPAPDRLHGRALSPRHPHDDRGRRHHQYRLDLCLAPARRPPHRLSPGALPARHHPLRRGRSCRHGRHGMDHLPACQSLAAAPLAHRPGCCALLCRHAPGGR